MHHWKGDGAHTLTQARDAGILTSFTGQTAGTPAQSADATTWRWNPDRWIEKQISEYDRILTNLRRHDARYPSARELRSKVAGKAVIATIGNQDNAYADYIGRSWPDIRVYNWGFTFTSWTGGKTNAAIPETIKPYYKNSFWKPNIKTGHGPLLDGYHLIGDGHDPTLGSWGGRFAATGAQFAPQGDVNPVTGRAEAAYSLYRWVPDAEDDFAARAGWGVTSSYKKANHAPTVKIRQEDLSARPGQTLTLRADVAGPDRDRVTSTWSVYTEASTAAAVLRGDRLTIPAGATAGQRAVLTLTATDDGRHTLSGYGQVVVTVR
ncbi:hypothetical protein ACFY36_12320 [Actinoplanes sp. NPDC000266]